MLIENIRNCIRTSEDKLHFDCRIGDDILEEFVKLKLISNDRSLINALSTSIILLWPFAPIVVEFFIEFVLFVVMDVVFKTLCVVKSIIEVTLVVKWVEGVEAELEIDSLVEEIISLELNGVVSEASTKLLDGLFIELDDWISSVKIKSFKIIAAEEVVSKLVKVCGAVKVVG